MDGKEFEDGSRTLDTGNVKTLLLPDGVWRCDVPMAGDKTLIVSGTVGDKTGGITLGWTAATPIAGQRDFSNGDIIGSVSVEDWDTLVRRVQQLRTARLDATHQLENFETEPIVGVEVCVTYRSGRTDRIHLHAGSEERLEASFSMKRDYKREFRGEEGTPSDESRFIPTGVTTLELKATHTQSPDHPAMKEANKEWHAAQDGDHH